MSSFTKVRSAPYTTLSEAAQHDACSGRTNIVLRLRMKAAAFVPTLNKPSTNLCNSDPIAARHGHKM